MPLFQHSVLKKYLTDLPKDKVQASWDRFGAHFQNPTIQQNILNAKEEEYQEGFVRDLFVNILGYTLKPQPDYNLVLEQKSTSDSTKSDGAILSGEGAVIAVIELKDTNTTDLAKVEKQAFGYKHQHKECRYVITSNFQHLRLYISDAIDFESFDLFHLNKESFALLYCCLHQSALQGDVPLKMKQQSIAEEENITKKLYADYSRFRKQLFGNISTLNPQYNKLELFKKTQKLMDRFLFLLFAEDRLLLPPNSVRDILKNWDDLRRMDEYRPLYDRFRKFFGYINTGYGQGANEIYPYNGGLFVPDEILDNIRIDDNLLYDSCKALSNYDFESEVDVNILGHIFEHSLSEIEKIEQELLADPDLIREPEAKYNTKRKKDGVYYTPRYITKYIVENTIGTLCTQKREEFHIEDDDYGSQKKKAEKQQLLQKLEDYREWLLQLTICDPACGSGAFLNQALEYLIREHLSIDQLKARLFGGAFHGSDVETGILEHNLYGVDINEEAVEIAKLSLWIRTAQKGRKLNDLSQHIKCGNSLIDDPAVAGDKAFNWQNEFPEVFAKGGFDVVIGNPPYVPSKTISDNEKNFYNSQYSTAEYQVNTFTLFIELTLLLINNSGNYGLIVPNYFVATKYNQALRKKIIFDNGLIEMINVFNVFDAVTVDTLILIGQKITRNTFKIKSLAKYLKTIPERLNALSQDHFSINTNLELNDLPNDYQIYFEESIDIRGEISFADILDFKMGLKPYEEGKGIPIQTRNIMEQKAYHSKNKIDNTYVPLLTSSSVKRYLILWDHEFIKYGENLAAKREDRIFKEKRILLNRILSKNKFDACYIEEYYVNNTDIFNIIQKENPKINVTLKALTGIIASSLCAYYFLKKNINLNRSSFPKINVNTLETFPIPLKITGCEKVIESKVDVMLSRNKELLQIKQQILNLLKGKYGSLTFTNKLKNLFSLTFEEFLKELDKQKIKLTLTDQSEWIQYFEAEKAKANAIQELINKTDKEIDAMVYELYGLTEEEVRVVEGV